MVLQLDVPPGAGDLIPLRRPQLEVSQACLAEAEELAELLHTSSDQALELAVSIALRAVYEGLAYCVGAAPRPPDEAQEGWIG